MIQKTSNSPGLPPTDFAARPEQSNRAFDIIVPKLRRSPTGITDGWGLKIPA